MSFLTKTLASLLLISIFQGCSDDTLPQKLSSQESTESQQNIDFPKPKVIKNLVSTKEFHLQSVNGESFIIVKEGNSFNIQNNNSKLVLFDFFTTWCPACRSVAPHLSNIQNKYKKDLLVIGVLIEEDKSDEDIIKFQKRYSANYPITNSTSDINDFANFKFSNEVASLLRQPRSFPIPLLVMFKDGEYFTHYIGAVPEEMIESDIKEALELRGDK